MSCCDDDTRSYQSPAADVVKLIFSLDEDSGMPREVTPVGFETMDDVGVHVVGSGKTSAV